MPETNTTFVLFPHHIQRKKIRRIQVREIAKIPVRQNPAQGKRKF
jgi:hypothetical protein